MHRRLVALESRGKIGPPKVEIWINEGDRLVHPRTRRVLTHQAFKAAFSNAKRFTLNIFEKRSRDNARSEDR
jgi:hypothetical protein